MIVIGFMIMFRTKLGSQTIVTVGNALPQIILGLILTTFSFSIVGLMLDAGKVAMSVSEKYIRDGFGDQAVQEIKIVPLGSITDYSNSAISTHMKYKTEADIEKIKENDQITQRYAAALNILEDENNDEASNVASFYRQLRGLVIGNAFATAIINWDISASFGGELVAEPFDVFLDILFTIFQIATLPELILLILVLIISFYAGFRLFLAVLMLYGRIFIDTITAPLVMLMGVLPGNSSQITNWFKRLTSSILSFSVIFLTINFVRYLALSGVIDTSTLNFFGNTPMAWPNRIIPLEFVIVVFGYLFAANIPKTMNKILKVGESKEMAGAMQDTMKSASKIPLVGALFK
jgi:hypothetical protein